LSRHILVKEYTEPAFNKLLRADKEAERGDPENAEEEGKKERASARDALIDKSIY
jgi:hypothetical protein